ncbi:hypothetical protein NC653_015429 [Populus alba x Populus x berolinensis]|uniref:Uncharacterized protein n=1 Tax=Populus alba x Populus x berolinensis TaxID=444605 RepID=A0AAD6VY75_9ROSI|nr:hypothetical protein NC653_015429 [Populus alba x Populus x berolinensis]
MKILPVEQRAATQIVLDMFSQLMYEFTSTIYCSLYCIVISSLVLPFLSSPTVISFEGFQPLSSHKKVKKIIKKKALHYNETTMSP